jgi:glycosyltransferase involved in cell wall biosynthesis
MAMGLPVVLSDIVQHKEIFNLNPDIGQLYNLYNVDDLKKKMLQFDDLSILDAGKNGRELATTSLSDIRMSNEYQEFYRRLGC